MKNHSVNLKIQTFSFNGETKVQTNITIYRNIGVSARGLTAEREVVL